MSDAEGFSRQLRAIEKEWLRFILPESSNDYARFYTSVTNLIVLGEGRWGKDDYILGIPGQEIDRTEGMLPVKAYGEMQGTGMDGVPCRITLAVHEPNDEGMVEFQVANLEGEGIPEQITVTSQWTYSTWRPGQTCPATGGEVRGVVLNHGGGNEGEDMLLLVLSPQKEVMWLYDGIAQTVQLIPVTNYYNELMVMKEIRDPKVALRHKRLFTDLNEYTDHDLRKAFRRYNNTFTKIAKERLAPVGSEKAEHGSILNRLKGIFGGNS